MVTSENNAFTINPRNYETLVGFAHDFCKGCIYEISSFGKEEDERVRNCYSCILNLDIYYKERQSLLITKDENGKNIAKSVIEK